MNRAVVVAVSVFCALLGGALALTFWSLSPVQRVVAVVAGTVLGTAVALLVTRADRPPSPEPDPVPAVRRPPPVTTDPWYAPSAGRSRLALPLSGDRHDSRPGPPSLADYDPGSAQIAQCPACGGFRLDVLADDPEYRFRCRTDGCRHTWSWASGTPWPPVVARRYRGGPPAHARRD